MGSPPTANIEPGARLDRYVLLALLARGGMANVWLARPQGLGGGRLYAVKTILPHVADDPSFKAMFLDESRIASRIDHPNVVKIVDVGEYMGTVPYLVMDLVEGEPLAKLPRACTKLGQRIPLGVVLRVLADASHGLHAAHELRDERGELLGIVHRDMSPQNILVSSSGLAKVIDFGVAKARDRVAADTMAGTLKGKINYMPREQAHGMPVDRRADTWALGAVLYFLLSGRTPYKADTQLATLRLAMDGAPVPPLPSSMPMSLRGVVMRALDQDPERRFQTAADLGDALESLMQRLSVVTTHAEVAAFVQKALAEDIEAQRALIDSALAEAANLACVIPTPQFVPVQGRVDETSSLNEGIVAVPPEAPPMRPRAQTQPMIFASRPAYAAPQGAPASMAHPSNAISPNAISPNAISPNARPPSPMGPNARPPSANDATAGGTVTPNVDRPKRRRRLGAGVAFGLAALGVCAVAGYTMRARVLATASAVAGGAHARSEASAEGAATATPPASASAPADVTPATAVPASAGAPAVAATPATTTPATATPATTTPATATPSPRPPATAAPIAAAPVSAAAAVPRPSRAGTPAATPIKKRLDDEAGF